MRTKRYKVRLRGGRYSSDVDCLLDMLRYEGARVMSWGRHGEGWDLTLESSNYTPDRWLSFGVVPEEVDK